MTVTKHLSAVAVAFLLTFGSTQSTNAEPLRIRYGIWVGYGPLFIAAEKGLFAREGVEVELIRIDDMTAAFAALFAAQVDGMVGGTQDIVTFAARFGDPSDEPVVCMLATDDSRGGDGILATKDIRTIADLRGKSVAVLRARPMSRSWTSMPRMRSRSSRCARSMSP